METKKTNHRKKPHSANSFFPCGDFQKMTEMLKNCCPGEGGAMDCCSMMRKMVDQGKGKDPEKTHRTRKPSEGGGNG